jgi:hypothetical protein
MSSDEIDDIDASSYDSSELDVRPVRRHSRRSSVTNSSKKNPYREEDDDDDDYSNDNEDDDSENNDSYGEKPEKKLSKIKRAVKKRIPLTNDDESESSASFSDYSSSTSRSIRNDEHRRPSTKKKGTSMGNKPKKTSATTSKKTPSKRTTAVSTKSVTNRKTTNNKQAKATRPAVLSDSKTNKKNKTNQEPVTIKSSSDDYEEVQEPGDILEPVHSETKKRKSSETTTKTTVKKPRLIGADETDQTFDILMPNASNESCCHVLVQIPEHSNLNLLAGAQGAVGRIEIVVPEHDDNDENTNINNNQHSMLQLDWQGTRYMGKIYPGPTALLLGITSTDGTLRIEGQTDEFCHLEPVASDDHHQKATVANSFLYNEEDVNINNPQPQQPSTSSSRKSKKDQLDDPTLDGKKNLTNISKKRKKNTTTSKKLISTSRKKKTTKK